MPADNKDKVTILKLRKQKQNNVKTVGVTAYDYPQALMADNAGVDWILVGDYDDRNLMVLCNHQKRFKPSPP